LPGEISAESIRSKIPSIFDWLSLQTVNEYVILILMILVAIINMTTGILIFIIEKSNMIGLFKALGANNWPIRKIFLRYASKIILFGLFWGNLIGLSLAAIQKYFKIVKLNEADYYISNVPVHFNIWWILLINLGALLIVLFCMIVPTYYISTVKPTKILKFD
jgi:lipoprotein-releasing system permease protein